MSESALIDLGKRTFHPHGQNKLGREVFCKKCSWAQMMQFFGNSPSCIVVMNACARSHDVARQLAAMARTAKLTSPRFVTRFNRRMISSRRLPS